MSKHVDPRRLDRQPHEPTSALTRLLDTPHLAHVVSRLTPDVLHQVIRHHGIDACGALVAAATPQQVTAILDLDLWRPAAAGGTEQFDAARFGAWLEALMEEGDAVAARVVAQMDQSLAVAALSRYVRVFDPGIFEPTFSSDEEREWNGPQPTDDSECEVGGYLATIEQAPPEDRADTTVRDVELAASLDVVAEVMAEAGIAPRQPRGLLGPAASDAVRVMPLERLMEFVFESDPAAYLARNQELTFLANALMAGCSVYTRPLTIQEAWNVAVGVCNLGLDRGSVREAFLVDHDLIAEFETGWRLLHESVSLFVTDRLLAALAEIRSVDDDVQNDLNRLRRELQRERAAGTPWRAAESLEVIAILDTPAWACLCGLLSECPVVPDALAAILDGRRSAVSATVFACFTTRGQVNRVREFGGRLRDLLLH